MSQANVQVPAAAPNGAPPPAAPAVAPQPASAKPAAQRPGDKPLPTVIIRKTYDTGGRHDSPSGRKQAERTARVTAALTGADGAAATSAAAAPQTMATKPEETQTPAATEAATESPADSAGAVTPAAQVAAPTPEATPDAPAKPTQQPALNDAEYAKRMAHITRREGKLSEGQRKLADERQALATERAQHKVDLERVSQMNNAQELARKDPLGFMHRVFGLKPSEVIDHAIRAGQKKPEQAQVETTSATEARIAELEAKLQKAEESTAARQSEQSVQRYVSETISPILTDKDRFRFLNAEFGASAASQVYNTMASHYQRTLKERGRGESLPPEKVAEFIETQLKKEAERKATLLGYSAPPNGTATPKVATAPAARPVAAQPAASTSPSVTPSPTRRPRLTGKPYTSTPK